jgi:hypothetical protein
LLSLSSLSLSLLLDQERFEYLRTREVKHGRVAMLAIVGHLVTGAGIR